MKIILGVDAITQPVTGIGRYAWELAKRLPGLDEIQEAIFFAYGKFVSCEALLSIGDESLLNTSVIQWNILSALRRKLARSRIVSKAYCRFMPAVEKFRLRSRSNYLFHSPTCILPHHDGPSIATVHDLSVILHPEWHPNDRVERQNAAISKTLGAASHIITVSKAVRQEVIDYFSWPAGKITVVPHGVDGMFFRPGLPDGPSILSSLGLTQGAFALCVATIEPRKNIERLIRAYENIPASLRRKYPLVLAGDEGWNSKNIHGLINQARRKGWLRYLGYVPDSCLRALYGGCRAFLYPSLYEGFGLPLLEAMACGAPVLTSNCSCMPEVVGDTGILVDPNDVFSISYGIEKALTDETWRLYAVENGLRRAGSMTWDVSAQRTVEVYKKIWNGRKQ